MNAALPFVWLELLPPCAEKGLKPVGWVVNGDEAPNVVVLEPFGLKDVELPAFENGVELLDVLPTGVPVELGGSLSTSELPKLLLGLNGFTVLPANPVG